MLTKTIKSLFLMIVFATLFTSLGFGLTAEQLQMLQQLTPQERQILMQQLGGDQTISQPPLYSPQVVLPATPANGSRTAEGAGEELRAGAAIP